MRRQRRTGGVAGAVVVAVAVGLLAPAAPPAAAQQVQAPPTIQTTPAPAVVVPATELTVPPPPTDPNTPSLIAVPGPAQTAPEVTAAGAVLWDPADAVVLAGVAEDAPLRMASTTKVMTVLLALEALEAGLVADSLVVSAAAAAVGRIPGGASLGLQEGEVVAVRDLLAALLLRSGNDGAVAIAEHVAGSEAAFVAEMNQRARDLGLIDTAFVNATGLTDELSHHATPLDLAWLGQIAMDHPDFASWAGATSLDLPPFGLLENRNELLQAYPGATGIKTGFTNLAGLCLVASAERDGRVLYAVVLGSEDRVADTAALFDHGFSDYPRVEALGSAAPAATYRWSGGEVVLEAQEALARTVGDGAQIATEVRLAPDAALPVAAGTPLGEAVMMVDGQQIERTALVAAGAIAAPAADSVSAAVSDALRAFARLDPRGVVAG